MTEHDKKLIRVRPRNAPYVLTLDQLRCFLQVAEKQRIGTLLWFALCTGMRQGELLSLRWSDLNGETRALSIRRTRSLHSEKTSAEEKIAPSLQRTILLPPSLLETLLHHQEEQRKMRLADGDCWDKKGLIFSTAQGEHLSPARLRRGLQQVCREAELPSLRFHDLRHNTVSMLFFLGIDPGVIQAMLSFKAMYSVVKNLAPIPLTSYEEAIQKIVDYLGAYQGHEKK